MFRVCEYLVFLIILKLVGLFYLLAIVGAQIVFVTAKFVFGLGGHSFLYRSKMMRELGRFYGY